MASQSSKKVGVIGLGHMGCALAESLLANNFRITVWNRTLSKADQVRDLGAAVSRSVGAVAQDSKILVVCLLDQAAIRNVILSAEVGKSLQNKSLIQLTTTTKDEVDELWEENPPMFARPLPMLSPPSAPAIHFYTRH